MAFEVEEIPDEARVFHHVHRDHFSGGHLSSAIFKRAETSVNWEKYSSVDLTRRPKSKLIISLFAGAIRSAEASLIHSPINEGEPYGPNQAHSDIIRNSKIAPAQLVRLAQICWISQEERPGEE